MLLDDYKERLAFALSSHRYEHSLNVMEAAGELALRWGVDQEKALAAGLLHDAARDLPLEEMLQESLRAGIEVGPIERGAPVLLHAPVGAYLLQRDWGVGDEDILQAVAEHTLGKPAMSALSRIVYLADMTERNRSFAGVEEIRRLALQDLDKAMALSLDYVMSWLKQKEAAIHPVSLAAYQYYQERAKDS